MRALDRLVEFALGALSIALVATAFAQVVARYVFSRPFPWMLELDIFLLVWATYLSGYVGIRRDCHLRVTFLLERMSAERRRRAERLNRVLAIVFVTLLGVKSFDVIAAMSGITFTALPLGMDVLYWSLPISSGLMLVALIEGLVRDRRPAK
jgi:TRAP-type C4-dicarboxylate transport system permease small subunit